MFFFSIFAFMKNIFNEWDDEVLSKCLAGKNVNEKFNELIWAENKTDSENVKWINYSSDLWKLSSEGAKNQLQFFMSNENKS